MHVNVHKFMQASTHINKNKKETHNYKDPGNEILDNKSSQNIFEQTKNLSDSSFLAIESSVTPKL